jgi:hypothetical protein
MRYYFFIDLCRQHWSDRNVNYDGIAYGTVKEHNQWECETKLICL